MEQIHPDIRKLLFIYSQKNALEKQRNSSRHKAYYNDKKVKRLVEMLSKSSNLTKVETKKLLSRIKIYASNFNKYSKLTKKAAAKKAAITKRYKAFTKKVIKKYELKIDYLNADGFVHRILSRHLYMLHPNHIWFNHEDFDVVAAEYEAEKAFERIINGQEKSSKKETCKGQSPKTRVDAC